MAGAYLFPNDDLERTRLDWQHAIIKARFDNVNAFAPLKRPKRILDIGCGTGKWCIEMAKQFHTAMVEGIGLSPIQPTVSPENVAFYIDDIRRKEWWHCTQPYDYIHTRMSLGIFRDFREIIQKGYNNLEPGGFMESHELFTKIYCDDGTMPPDYELLEWMKTQDRAAMTLGMPLRIANKLKTWYEQAGFVDVHEEVFSIPVNAWARDSRFKLLGKFMQWNMCQGVHAWTVEYFTKALQWTDAEVEVYLAHLRNAISDRSVHSYYKVWVVWGRKPFPDEPPSQTAKPAHWPQEPDSDDEGDEHGDALV
jgi:SAM-dependent methyltransferase